jgi:hypothetical protein
LAAKFLKNDVALSFVPRRPAFSFFLAKANATFVARNEIHCTCKTPLVDYIAVSVMV